MRNIVIFKNPRGINGIKPSQLILIHAILALTSITIILFLPPYRDLQNFTQKNQYIKIDSFDGKLIGSLFFPIFYFAMAIAAIRNNTKSQPVESFLVIFSLCFAAFFFLFGTPAMFLWAHWNGYVLDHYEATHRGGWYFFKLAGK